jgi:hypothetical protein
MGLIGGPTVVDDVVCEMRGAYSIASIRDSTPVARSIHAAGASRLGQPTTPLEPHDETLEQLRAHPGAELQQRRRTDPGRASGHGAVPACGAPGVTDGCRRGAALGTAR